METTTGATYAADEHGSLARDSECIMSEDVVHDSPPPPLCTPVSGTVARQVTADGFALGSMPRRCVAATIDGAVIYALGRSSAALLREMLFARHDWIFGAASVLFLFPMLVIAYPILSEGLIGTTVGKWLLNLRVVQMDGTRAGWGHVALRGLLRLLDWCPGFGLIGIAVAANSPLTQRVGDRVAGTMVVRRHPTPTFGAKLVQPAVHVPVMASDFAVPVPRSERLTRGGILASTLVSGVIGGFGVITLLCVLGLGSDFPPGPNRQPNSEAQTCIFIICSGSGRRCSRFGSWNSLPKASSSGGLVIDAAVCWADRVRVLARDPRDWQHRAFRDVADDSLAIRTGRSTRRP